MSFATYKGEKSVQDLVTRLFTLPDKSAKTAKRAADSLVAANPQLNSLDKMTAGSLLEIPANAPPLKSSETASAGVLRREAVIQQAQKDLYLLDRKLADIDEKAEKGANALLAQMHSKPAQAVLQSSGDLKEQAAALVSAVQSAARDAKARKESRSATLAEFQKALGGTT